MGNVARTDNATFAQLMSTLRACYPSMRKEGGDWRGTLEAYSAALRPYGLDVVVRTFERAVKTHREFFPSAGQLVEIAEAERKRPEVNVVHTKQIVSSPELPELKQGNPFNLLSKAWGNKNESGANWSGTQRWKEFWATWDGAEKWNDGRSGSHSRQTEAS